MAGARMLSFPLPKPFTIDSRSPPALLLLCPLKLTIFQPIRSPLYPPRRRAARVVSSLPTANPEWPADEKKIQWSSRSIRSFAVGELEARKLKYPDFGTEALLLGILVEGTSIAAKFLRANGLKLVKVREEIIKLLGKSDMLLAYVVEDPTTTPYPPLTEQAQKALDWAVNEKLKSSGESGEVTVTHMLLGIWSQKESAGHKILVAFGFDDSKITELAKSASKDVHPKYS